MSRTNRHELHQPVKYIATMSLVVAQLALLGVGLLGCYQLLWWAAPFIREYAPALPRSRQGAAILGLLGMAMYGAIQPVFSWMWRRFRNNDYRFSLGSLLLVVTAVALAVGMLCCIANYIST